MSPSVSARWYAIATAGLALLAACSSSMETIVPQGITVTPPTLSFSSKGATQQLTATVTDQHGNTIRNATVTWSSNNTAVATVTSSGLAASVGNGTTQIVVAAGVVTTTVTVTVAQTAFTVAKTAGDNQSATVGTQLPQALAVQVTDALGNPVPNVGVSFSVTSGGGSVSPLSVLTDASGNASAQWTIGTSTTTQQQVAASVAPATPAVFNATATAGAAKSVVKQAGDNQLVATGTAAPIKPAVLVSDQFGNPVANVTVTYAAGLNSGSVTGGTVQTSLTGIATVGGWTVNASPGTDTLFATVTGSSITNNPAKFLATVATPGPPASVVVQAGDGQTGLDGYALNFNPAVLVRDMSNIPVANAQVTFTVATGGGSVSGGSVMTGTDGVATVGSWTVGPNPGSNTLTATVTGGAITGNPVTFTATGAAPTYNIDVRYLAAVPTGARKAAFDSAVAFWQRAIFGDVPNIPLNIAANTCFNGQPAMNETVDDIVIFVLLDSIDGPGKILGQAGPCYIRSSDKLPIMGLIELDTADLQGLQNSNELTATITHEMAHVLGFGSIWSCSQIGLCLLAGPASQGGSDPHFIGSQALAAFDRIGGINYTGGAKVPVENCLAPTTCPGGGAASIDAHWRESVFGNELMTSVLNAGLNPVSVLTIAAMGDEGYTVNYAAAQPYTHTFSVFAAPAPTASMIHLENDLLNLPIYTVDAAGRVTGVWRR